MCQLLGYSRKLIREAYNLCAAFPQHPTTWGFTLAEEKLLIITENSDPSRIIIIIQQKHASDLDSCFIKQFQVLTGSIQSHSILLPQ